MMRAARTSAAKAYVITFQRSNVPAFHNTMHLHLGGHLDWYDAGKRPWQDIALPQPILLTDLLAQLGIPAGEVAIVALNRRAVPLVGTIVTDEDRVELYPPMGGG